MAEADRRRDALAAQSSGPEARYGAGAPDGRGSGLTGEQGRAAREMVSGGTENRLTSPDDMSRARNLLAEDDARKSRESGPVNRRTSPEEMDRVKALLEQADTAERSGARVSGESPHAVPKGAAAAAEGVHVKGRGGLALNAAFAVAAGGIALATGASPAEAAEAGLETAVPFADAGKELARGNTDAAQKSAALEIASGAGSLAAGAVAGTMGAGVVVATGAAVVGGMAAYETGKMIYETPERLRTGEKFRQEKEDIVSRFEGGKDGHVAELVNAVNGKPTDIVKGLEDPETLAEVRASLRSEKREGDLKTLDDFEKTDRQYADAMRKFGVDASPEKRVSDKNLDNMHQLGF